MVDPYRTRKAIGLVLYVLFQLVGLALLALVFIVVPLLSNNAVGSWIGFGVGAMLAFPAMCMYLTFPRLLDRYDPEPWYALLMVLLWGAIAACGFSAFLNDLVGGIAANVFGVHLGGPEAAAQFGEVVTVVLSAPFVEEGFKALAILGVFYFLRDEFDGLVDGVMYATFVAIGFAATENVLYYGRALLENPGALAFVFVLRGVIAPWGHPLYTSMTGLGLGLARESSNPFVKYAAPLVGYGLAVLLHMIWNGSATVFAQMQDGTAAFVVALVFWLAFVAAFVTIVMGLVWRRGRIIRQHLLDEVALKNISQAELDLVASPFGGLVAWFRKGGRGEEFVRTVARLGLSKWHTARAMKGRNQTYSMDFIVPLRAKIKQLRAQGASPA